MEKYKTISLEAVRVRPIDPSSKLSHVFPGEHLFDDRSDFILFGRQSHVAVLATFRNERPGQRMVVRSFPMRVSLTDLSTGECLASKDVVVNMLVNEQQVSMRCDLLMSGRAVDVWHDYEVSVTLLDEKERQLGTKVFRLFRFPVLPTRLFKGVNAYLSVPGNSDAGRVELRSPGGVGEVVVNFLLEMGDGLPAGRLPEVDVVLTAPDGVKQHCLCRPECRDAGRRMAGVESSAFKLDVGNRGVYYAELCCMGHAFTGFLFDTDCCARQGMFSGDELGSILYYTPSTGYGRLHPEGADRDARPAAGRMEDEDFDRMLDDFIKASCEDSTEPAAAGNGCDESSPVVAPPSPMQKLDRLMGLDDVKRKVREYAALARFRKMRERAGLPAVPTPLHALFLGSPGTGKTTVAHIMGELLHEAGVLSVGHVVVRERATLLGQYYNSEAEKTLEALKQAKGGILFIDEAYQLHQPSDPKDPGRFVLETLMTALSDETNRDWMLILAGYTEPMMRMLDLNPGLRSRIPDSNFYEFKDFSVGQLLGIADSYFASNSYRLQPEARNKLQELIAHDYRMRDDSFGNGRYVVNLIETKVLPSMATRLAGTAAPSLEELSTVFPADIPVPDVRIVSRTPRPVGFRA